MHCKSERRRALAWALYDWGNSAYATTVMAGFFPIFFKQVWAADLSAVESTFRLGLINSIAGIVIVLLAPLLGAVADTIGARKRFLLIFAALGILSTALLPLVAAGEWLAAMLLYLAASIGFSGSIAFYDSLLLFVAREEDYERTSALGYALGYLGGGLLFAANVWMTLDPSLFGLADKGEAVRTAFYMVAAWWLFFTLPLARCVEEPKGEGSGAWTALRGGIAALRDSWNHIRQLRTVAIFLFAYWFYIDGVDTIVRMAVDYGLSLGFESTDLIVALLITQFVGFPSALLFGRLGERLGPKRGIFIGLAVYVAVVLWAYAMESVAEFYALAVVVGLVQGGIQALSRSLYARLIPRDRSAEFFGFYNMLGKFAVVLGPLMVGSVAELSGSPRLGILSVLLLFMLGALLLSRVDVERARVVMN